MKLSFLKQKSKIHWLKDGDQNTRFFHKYVQAKQSREKISSLEYSGGIIVKDESGVSNEKNLFLQVLAWFS